MQPGDVVAGRFEVESIAGAGGMGIVMRARDRVSGGPVALKLLHDQDVEHRERFEREARILAALEHPGIVRYLARGETGGSLYLAMEWLDGESLASHLKRGRPSVAESLVVARRVADALAAAHARRIVHRDVKPSNVFLRAGRPDGAMLLDFGVAHHDELARATTRTGVAIGTPGYMAPEQVRGDRQIDARADVFALGCVLFECLTGRPAFVAEHVLGLMAKVLLDDAPRVRDLDPEIPGVLDALVARMLEKQPEDRPSDAAAVVAALDAVEASVGSEGAASARLAANPEDSATLSRGEQRFVCVILVDALGRGWPQRLDTVPSPEGSAGTLPTLAEGPDVALHAAVEGAGGRLERLADGSWVATVSAQRRDASATGVATDQAFRAARCALSMRSALPALPIAIATGRALTSALRSVPVGDAIDRAARLVRASAAETSEPLPVRIDDVTAGLLDAHFDIGGDEGGLVLRGERELVLPPRVLLGVTTPCVGRERELGWLRQTLQECIFEQSARVVLVSGPAGSGKSRLRQELLLEVERLGGVDVWTARGDPMRVSSAFGMLAPMVRGLAGIRDGESLEIRRQKLRARVERHLRGLDAARVAAFLGEMASVSFADDPSLEPAVAAQLRCALADGILMGDQILRAFEDLVAAELEAGPLLLVLEDLHWGDRPSVRLVGAARRRASARALMVLAVARPGVDLVRALDAQEELSELRLPPLPRRAATSLVHAVLGSRSIGADVVSRIVERSEGNAFFLEELIRAVAEGREDDAPETVLAMVQTRLERLEPEVRRALRAASVFGQTFWRGGVDALTGASRTRPSSGVLDTLAALELVEARPTCRFPGEEELRFRHAIVRDAAYASLTDSDRELGHRLAATWLEAAGETDAATLANHHERGRNVAAAAIWLRRAAEQALEGHDFAAAIERAQAAAESATGRKLGALRVIEAEARRWRGDFAAAESLAVEAALMLPPGERLWFRALEEAMSAWTRQGRYELGHDTAVEVARVVAADGARSAQIMALCAAARMLFHAGHYDDADVATSKAAALVVAAEPEQGATVRTEALDPRALAEVHRLRGARARHRGDLAGDVEGYDAALRAFVEAGDARNACNTRVSLGFAHIELGDHERAERELEAALLDAERMGLHPVSTRARQNLGLVRAARGRLDEAIALERAVIDASAAHGNVRFEGWSRIYLAL
ncbi:MAG: protein kinase, partial [Deltaproteobacteria bacterium]|nr:protein kinase [Deltaproteobacteria bacterium]